MCDLILCGMNFSIAAPKVVPRQKPINLVGTTWAGKLFDEVGYIEIQADGKAKFVIPGSNREPYDYTYVIEKTRIKLTIYNGYSWFEGEITEATMTGKLENKAGRVEERSFQRERTGPTE